MEESIDNFGLVIGDGDGLTSSLLDDDDLYGDSQHSGTGTSNTTTGFYSGTNDVSLGNYIENASETQITSQSITQNETYQAATIEGPHSVILYQGDTNFTHTDDHDHSDEFESIAADAQVGGSTGFNAVESNYVWANDGTGITLDFNFYTSLPGFYSGVDAEYASGFQAMNANQAAASRQVLSVIEQYANITFNEVGAGDAGAEISFGQVARSDVNIVAHAWYPTGSAVSGDVFLNTAFWGYDADPQIGDLVYQTLFHEIGHALGLKHSFDAGAGSGDTLIAAEENNQYSVMSYTRAGGNAASMMMHDIAALQSKYGVNTTYNTSNDTYTVSSDYHFTIWDAGGIDTLDASAQSVDVTLRLQDGSLSDIGATKKTGIAFNAIIENATGGSGNDNLYGNDVDNVLLGGGGNDTFYGSIGDDTINGQAGTDTANYNFATTAFNFDFIDAVTVSFEHIAQAWTDTLSNIESFVFTDGTYTFQQLKDAFDVADTNDFAPTVTANDLTLDKNATIMAADHITANDADGNDLTYEVWDGTKSNTSGYFDLNGTKLSAGKGHTLTQSQFDDLMIVGGTSNGLKDFLYVRVSDGVHTTNWNSFDLTTIVGSGQGDLNAIPTITTNDLTLDIGETVLASSIATIADADGDTLTYNVWDSSTSNSSGYFQLGGAALTAGTSHSLTQAQFDALQIVGGSEEGQDTMWIQVSDGKDTTTWSRFFMDTDAGGAMVGPNAAPTASANDLTLGSGAFVLANTVITANDADGDALTYEVWDGGKVASSGHFDLNGTILSAGSGHSLTQAEFDALKIVGGNINYTETMWVRVSDGAESTSWIAFDLTTDISAGGGGANTAPTVTANNASAETNQAILASTALGGNDVDGDTLTYYVWDGGNAASSGFFRSGGVKLTAGRSHTLTQAEFDALEIVGGSATGSETMWMRVSDGDATTTWAAFTFTTDAPSSFTVTQDESLDYTDIISDEDSLEQALSGDMSGDSEVIASGDDAAYSGDVFSGVSGFEDNTENGALI